MTPRGGRLGQLGRTKHEGGDRPAGQKPWAARDSNKSFFFEWFLKSRKLFKNDLKAK
jgi:hypothetical protein